MDTITKGSILVEIHRGPRKMSNTKVKQANLSIRQGPSLNHLSWYPNIDSRGLTFSFQNTPEILTQKLSVFRQNWILDDYL